MSNYTQGPWVVHKRDDEDEGTLIKHVGENDDVFVCVTNVNWRYPKVNAANARLIAATPDLLAVCQKFINNWDNLHHKDLMQARMAVAKAEGRE